MLCAALAAAVLAGGGALLAWRGAAAPAMGPALRGGALIIDAGHGGEDGGAVSITGALESQINLDVALKLEDVLAFYGVAPELLRREDLSLHDVGSETLREKKVSDLHNRERMIRELGCGLLVSIHQNSYPDGRYRGAQVFYAPTEGSKAVAEHVQAALAAGLDPDNGRKAKPIPDSVYLLNHVDCAAILVECGFLTNPEEEALLRSDGYQRRLAAVLAGAILTAPGPTNEDTGV